jgi:2-methylisocitrate lyase-like PEP mutase family enzyme
VITPVGGLFAATRALRDAFGVLHEEGTLRNHLDRLVPFDEFTAIVGLPEIAELESRYAT